MAITDLDTEIAEAAEKADHRTLAIWAADCAERALPHFEEKRPGDGRPRFAIEALREWIRTGEFSMSVIRKASLGAHAAARDAAEDDAARSAARAAGQAVAATHVPAHSRAAAIYAATAVRDARGIESMGSEKEWQLEHLIDLAACQEIARN